MFYCNEYKFSLDSARESRTSSAFFRMKRLGHLALRNTWWLYQDVAVLTKTLLTDSIPGFLHPWSSCNLVHFAAHLAHFPVPISVLTEFDQYSNLFLKLIFYLTYFISFQVLNSPFDLSYHYSNASVYLRQSSKDAWHPPLTTCQESFLVPSLCHKTLEMMMGKKLADIKEP